MMGTVIVGAGAMGSLVGALLSEKGVPVTLYDQNPELGLAIKKQGIELTEGESRRQISAAVAHTPQDLPEADLVILLVKSYDTRRALKAASQAITKETLVLTLQNGAGHVEIIGERIPRDRIFSGVTTCGAMLLSPGKVRQNGRGETFIGPMEKRALAQAEKIAALLNGAGIKTGVREDMAAAIWTKLIANAAINPLTALMGCPNGALLKDDDLLALMETVVAEGRATAQALGIELLQKDMSGYVKSICQVTGENKSSMLMDILKKRPTEVDAINGFISRRGGEAGVPVPVNRALTGLIHGLERRVES